METENDGQQQPTSAPLPTRQENSQKILEIIRQKTRSGGVPENEILNDAKLIGIEEKQALEILQILYDCQEVICPRLRFYRATSKI